MLNADRQADITNLLNVEPGHDPESMRLWAERARVELTYLVESLATSEAERERYRVALAKWVVKHGSMRMDRDEWRGKARTLMTEDCPCCEGVRSHG